MEGYYWAPVNQLNHTRKVVVVTPIDRPKSVGNRYDIENFVALLCYHLAFIEFLIV